MSIFDNEPTRKYKSAGVKLRRLRKKRDNLDPFAPNYEKKEKHINEQIERCKDARTMAKIEMSKPKTVTNNHQTTRNTTFNANYTVKNYGIQVQPQKPPKKKR